MTPPSPSQQSPQASALETELRDLHRVATLVRQDGSREVWRAPLAGQVCQLWFYPQGHARGLARLGGGTAASDFANLQLMQERKVPVVRAIALLAGYRFGDRVGDAVLIDLDPTIGRLGDTLFTHPPAGRQRRAIFDGIVAILDRMGKERLGHDDLTPAAFVVTPRGVRLCEPRGVTREGLTQEQLWRLASAFAPAATTADRVRAFATLTPEARLPLRDPRAAWRLRRGRQHDTIQSIVIDGWSGLFRAAGVRPVSWSMASTLHMQADEWRREWPLLLQRIEAGQVDVLKSDASGDVLASEVRLSGRPIDVIIKRPRNKYVYRRLFAAFRASRARRLWNKAVALQHRHLPIEYPLITMDRRKFGYVLESIALFERVPGPTLAAIDLDAIAPAKRSALFFAAGRILRKIEQTMLTHTDAKSSNWIVFNDAGTPRPVMVDAYGIRKLNAFLQLFGIRRLLRAMRQHPQYTPGDSLALCKGFAPRATPPEESSND